MVSLKPNNEKFIINITLQFYIDLCVAVCSLICELRSGNYESNQLYPYGWKVHLLK